MEKNKKVQKRIDNDNKKTISRLSAINGFYNELCGLREERPDLLNLPTNEQIAKLTFKQISELLDELIKKNLIRIKNLEDEKQRMNAEMIQKRLEEEYEARLLKQGFSEEVIDAKYEAILATVDFLDDLENSGKPLSNIYKAILKEKLRDTNYRLKFQDYELDTKEKVAKFSSEFKYNRYNDFVKSCFNEIENLKFAKVNELKEKEKNLKNQNELFVLQANNEINKTKEIDIAFNDRAKALLLMISLLEHKEFVFNSENFVKEYLKIYKTTCLKDASAKEIETTLTRISHDLEKNFQPIENKFQSINSQLTNQSNNTLDNITKKTRPIIFQLLKDFKKTQYNHDLCLKWTAKEIKRLEDIQLPFEDGSKALAIMLDLFMKFYRKDKIIPEAKDFLNEYLRIYKNIYLKDVASSEAEVVLSKLSFAIKNKFKPIENNFENTFSKMKIAENETVDNICKKLQPIVFKLLQDIKKTKFNHNICLKATTKEIERIKNIELLFVNESKALEIMLDSFMESFSGKNITPDSKKFLAEYLRIYKMTCLKNMSPRQITTTLAKISNDIERKFEPIEKYFQKQALELESIKQEKTKKIKEKIEPIIFGLLKNNKKNKFDHKMCLARAAKEIKRIKEIKLPFDEEAKVLESMLNSFMNFYYLNRKKFQAKQFLNEYLETYKEICLKNVAPNKAKAIIAKITNAIESKFALFDKAFTSSIAEAKNKSREKIKKINEKIAPIVFELLKSREKSKFGHKQCIKMATKEITKIRNTNVSFVEGSKILELLLDSFIENFNSNKSVPNGQKFLDEYLKIYRSIYLRGVSLEKAKIEISKITQNFNEKFKPIIDETNEKISAINKNERKKIDVIMKRNGPIIFQMLATLKTVKFNHTQTITKAKDEINRIKNSRLPFSLEAIALEQMIDLFAGEEKPKNSREFLDKYLKIYKTTVLKNKQEEAVKKQIAKMSSWFDKKFEAIDQETTKLLLEVRNEYANKTNNIKTKIKDLIQKLTKIDFSDHCLFTKDYIDAKLLSLIQEARIQADLKEMNIIKS